MCYLGGEDQLLMSPQAAFTWNERLTAVALCFLSLALSWAAEFYDQAIYFDSIMHNGLVFTNLTFTFQVDGR